MLKKIVLCGFIFLKSLEKCLNLFTLDMQTKIKIPQQQEFDEEIENYFFGLLLSNFACFFFSKRFRH